MERPWFDCEPVGEEFFAAAPTVLREEFEIARPAERVWADLTGDEALHWCRILQDVSWTSERPFGVGTTRQVKALAGAAVLRERYFLWDEEGRRHSFCVEQASAPLFASLAEDYLVEPTSEASCRFSWTIAYKPRALGRGPHNKALLASLFADTKRFYAVP